MRHLAVLLLLYAATVDAQVYRWVDAKGTAHYSNSPPPAGVKAIELDIDARAAAERAANAPKPVRGLEFASTSASSAA